MWSATDIDPFTGASIADYETLTAPLVDGAGDAAADAGNDTVVTLRRSTSPDEQPGPPTPVSPPLPAAFKFAARNSRMNFGEDSEDELEAARPLSPRRSFSYAEALETTPIAITTTDATDATPTPASPLSPASPGFDTIKVGLVPATRVRASACGRVGVHSGMRGMLLTGTRACAIGVSCAAIGSGKQAQATSRATTRACACPWLCQKS